jgi:hypothetical protein
LITPDTINEINNGKAAIILNGTEVVSQDSEIKVRTSVYTND